MPERTVSQSMSQRHVVSLGPAASVHDAACTMTRASVGSVLRLRKLHAGYDATDRYAALAYMQRHAAQGEIVTGLLYLDPLATDLHASLNTVAAPLQSLGRDALCPGTAQLDKINAGLR